jgi:hypothetical protein
MIAIAAATCLLMLLRPSHPLGFLAKLRHRSGVFMEQGGHSDSDSGADAFYVFEDPTVVEHLLEAELSNRRNWRISNRCADEVNWENRNVAGDYIAFYKYDPLAKSPRGTKCVILVSRISPLDRLLYFFRRS